MTSHNFDPTILRAYDIRGIVGETLTAADAFAIGLSFIAIQRIVAFETELLWGGMADCPPRVIRSPDRWSCVRWRRGQQYRLWADANAVLSRRMSSKQVEPSKSREVITHQPITVSKW